MRRRHDVHCGTSVGRIVKDMVEVVLLCLNNQLFFLVALARLQALAVSKCLATCPPSLSPRPYLYVSMLATIFVPSLSFLLSDESKPNTLYMSVSLTHPRILQSHESFGVMF